MKTVYCKKKFIISKTPNAIFSFVEGQYYKNLFFDDEYSWITLENGMAQCFYLNVNKKPQFKDYFYTIKELRNIKMSNIEKNII